MSVDGIITLIIAVIGAITGILGTMLGILGHRREVERDQLRLRVGTSWGLSSAGPDCPFLVLHVTNLSKFPVTIREAGLLVKNQSQRLIAPYAKTRDGPLPVRMESRTALSINFSPDFLLSDGIDDTALAYVSTECGEQVTVVKNDIPSMVKEARERAGREK